ncbi:hypothetical protein [Roseicyclus persicicus]|uniref:Uncharacterized protein n=1 Tax=Roseicyclus persicicus TaxID=2650661 RepID=A0A7X6GZP5_9RHOB|nr:hypothetical protein [Roseibacterium persicicum]NKX44077.1 hypothetical protein [Roseibacterium persicicum]
MRVIQIHAGIHKTGSTALQHRLARLAPDLAGHGIALPGFGPRGQGHHALSAFQHEPEACARAWARVARSLRATDAPRVLLSSEHFISAEPEALKAALDGLGPHEVRLHFYVRPHVGLFTSLYLQRIKAGVVRTGPVEVAHGYASRPEFDYVPAIERYIDVFGPEAVRVREFDPARFEGGSLMADAWAFLDLPAALRDRALAEGDAVLNPSPSAEQAALLFAVAARLRAAMARRLDPQVLRRSLAALFGELCARLADPATRYRLPLTLQEAIAESAGPARAGFARRLDRPASDAFLHEPLQRPDPIAPVPFEAVAASLSATAAAATRRGWAAVARSIDHLTAELRPADGALLRLDGLAPLQSEGLA